MNIIKPFDTDTGGDSPKDLDSEETNRISFTLCFCLLNICQQNANMGSPLLSGTVCSIHHPSDVLY